MSAIGFITCKDSNEAKKIATVLLEKKLIACANIVNGIESIYRWKGNIETTTEVLLILKTNSQKIAMIIPEIEKNQSHQAPAIEFVNMDHTAPKTQDWINTETK